MINHEILKSNFNFKRKTIYRCTAASWLKKLTLMIENNDINRWRDFLDSKKSIRIDGIEDLYNKKQSQKEFVRWIFAASRKGAQIQLTSTRDPSSVEFKKMNSKLRILLNSKKADSKNYKK